MGNSILARFWVTMVFLVVVLFMLSGLLLNKMLENAYYNSRSAEMVRQGEYLAQLVERDEGDAGLAQKLEMAAQLSHFAILVANNDGVIWKTGGFLGGKRGLPRLEPDEIEQMHQGKSVIRQRYSKRLDSTVLSVIVPYDKNGNLEGAVILQTPLSGLQAFMQKVRILLAAEMMGAILLVSVAAFFLARSLVKPIMTLAVAATGMARGQYDISVPETRQDELGVLAKSFNQMARAVERSIKIQKDFVANVSHELRTPLAIIKGYAESLLDGMVDGEQEKNKHLHIIVDEAERLGRLTTDLLDLAQLEAGNLRLNKGEIHLAAFVARVFGKFAQTAAEKHIMLSNGVTDEIIVWADHDRLFQVMFNLVGNALQFTPEGGEITVDASRVAGEVSIRVSDTGEGMEPEKLSRIWDRFYTGDQSRRRSGGRGLGLAITRIIVEAHGGSAEVISTMGQGTTFTVRLPDAGN